MKLSKKAQTEMIRMLVILAIAGILLIVFFLWIKGTGTKAGGLAEQIALKLGGK